MGHTSVNLEIGRLDASNGQARFSPVASLDALVDTGATYTCIPASLLERAQVKALPPPISPVRLSLAAGSVIERECAYVWMRILDTVIQTRVVIGKEGEPALLGVLALEDANLLVDPVSRRLLKRQAYIQY